MYQANFMRITSIRAFLPRISVFSLWLLLAACATTPPTPSTELDHLVAAPNTAAEAIADLQQLRGAEQSAQGLQWANIYLSRNQLAEARQLLAFLESRPLSAEQSLQRVLIAAQVAMAEGQPDEALALLDDDKLRQQLPQQPANLRARHGMLRADALTLKGDHLAAIEGRVAADPFFEDEAQQYNRRMIWTQLMQLSNADLQIAEQRHPADTELGGWLYLASLYRDPGLDIDSQLHSLQQWQATHPKHPAANTIPEMISALHEAARLRPTHVAVLLPEQGPFAPVAEAIRHGILAGYYQALEHNNPVPELTFYNSETDDIRALYLNAIEQGANLVIGPLDRDQIITLAQQELPVPLLALNYVLNAFDAEQPPANLFQFGLSPENEARQAAHQAIVENFLQAAVLYPKDASGFGQRVALAFEEEFFRLGGSVNAREEYADNATQTTRSLLLINRSEARAREVARRSPFTVNSEPRRRQDIDMIFLVANPAQGRQMKPALNFHYAGDLPVFSISHIYSGSPNPAADRDLNGIRFLDIPWLLETDTQLHRSVQHTWPSGHGHFERLFALGVDAYRLHARLNMLQQAPDSYLPGITGLLSIQQQQLVRQLNWAYFRAGQPQLMPTIIGSPTRDGL